MGVTVETVRRTAATRRLAVAMLAVALPMMNGLTSVTADAAVAELGGNHLRVISTVGPLGWLAERIGGDHVAVTALRPDDVTAAPPALLADADLIIVEDDRSLPWVATNSRRFNVAEYTDIAAPRDSDDRAFWLDPARLAEVGEALAARFAQMSPDLADPAARRWTVVGAQLDDLRRELIARLSRCARAEVIVSDHAFGHLAELTGLLVVVVDPERPSTRVGVAAETFYAMSTNDRGLARRVYERLGMAVASLDPLDGTARTMDRIDYMTQMLGNLEALRAGQHCPTRNE